ncbi:hypothetical protein CTheo_9096 [Ceratobasidium theobromae]|uniref:Uncharacterized protein n=1 Tax=Ceratobasidium theobromae TaxID=1582974 RepID=A0A5N5Q7S9_9AGAM|nr:hypothetical protein CTheo_9096 [Ceratobasidium theobromae]
MTNSLAVAFFSHPRGRVLVKGVDERSSTIVWNLPAVNEWLGELDRVQRCLMFITHGVGGQPGRGTETTGLKITNSPSRTRGFRIIGTGQGAYVLSYSKSGNTTGYDRIVVHALPWRVTRMFLIINGLVAPLAGQMVEQTSGVEARAVQHHSAFAAFGSEYTPDDLGDAIGGWFDTALGVDVRIRLFRHLVIGFQREKMPECFRPVERIQNIIDLQAGHTSETAEAHYAITPEQAHLLNQSTVKKYIAVSARWWGVLFEGFDLLTPRELGLAANAPSHAQFEEEGPTLERDGLHLGEGDLKLISEQLQRQSQTLAELKQLVARGGLGALQVQAATSRKGRQIAG